jgi:hypothetical protein
MPVSQRAVDLIINAEITSPEVYAKEFQHPTLPGADSGITVGVGYDLGQESIQQIVTDWSDYLPDEVVVRLCAVAGLRGQNAREALPGVVDIVVPYEAASAVFGKRSLPRFTDGTIKAMPKAAELPDDSLGALVSISYNRGFGGWTMTDNRHFEMAAIASSIEAGNLGVIPSLIRRMKRLWRDAEGNALPGCAGLLTRRDDEAQLFQDGLNAAATSVQVTA